VLFGAGHKVKVVYEVVSGSNVHELQAICAPLVMAHRILAYACMRAVCMQPASRTGSARRSVQLHLHLLCCLSCTSAVLLQSALYAFLLG
jgi:hypothetical protein